MPCIARVAARVLDSDRVFVAEAYQAVHRLAGMYSVQRDIEGDEVRITAAFKRYLASVGVHYFSIAPNESSG